MEQADKGFAGLQMDLESWAATFLQHDAEWRLAPRSSRSRSARRPHGNSSSSSRSNRPKSPAMQRPALHQQQQQQRRTQQTQPSLDEPDEGMAPQRKGKGKSNGKGKGAPYSEPCVVGWHPWPIHPMAMKGMFFPGWQHMQGVFAEQYGKGKDKGKHGHLSMGMSMGMGKGCTSFPTAAPIGSPPRCSSSNSSNTCYPILPQPRRGKGSNEVQCSNGKGKDKCKGVQVASPKENTPATQVGGKDKSKGKGKLLEVLRRVVTYMETEET